MTHTPAPCAATTMRGSVIGLRGAAVDAFCASFRKEQERLGRAEQWARHRDGIARQQGRTDPWHPPGHRLEMQRQHAHSMAACWHALASGHTALWTRESRPDAREMAREAKAHWRVARGLRRAMERETAR